MIKFEKFNKEKHDINTVANLKYTVDYRLYEKIFKNKKEATKTLKNILVYTSNINDKSQTYIILNENNEIIGFFDYYTSKANLIDEIFPLLKNLKFKDTYKLIQIIIRDNLILSKIQEKDFYIGELAISKKFQKQGYGTLTLKKLIKYAKNNNYKRVTLDVDFKNNNARNIYEKIGFKQYNKRYSRLFKRGMYNMEYIL